MVLLATEYRCPTCAAYVGDPCIDLEAATLGHYPEVPPHPAREELAKVRETDED